MLSAPGVGELPGFAGRGGAFAAGGGEAAGAGRAGGTVGIAALGVGLGAVAAADVAEVAGDAAGRRASEGVVAAKEADAGELAAGNVGAEAGRVASAARAVGMAGVPVLAGRADAAPIDAVAADVDADAGTVADAVVAPRVAPEAEPVGTAPVLAEGAGTRGAVPAAVGSGEADLDGADLLEVGCGDSAAALADLRAVTAAADGADAVADVDAAVAADEGVVGADAGAAAGPEAGAADKVGGIGASPDRRSEASNIGDAHVPEYALSVDVDAACEALVEPLELLDGVASAVGVAVGLDAFVAVVVGSLTVGAEAFEPVVAASDVDEPDALVERVAESVDERAEVFAAVGLDACPEVGAGLGRMPNPAGVLGVAIAAGALGPAVFRSRGAAAWARTPVAGAAADVAAEARGEIGVAAFAADGADAAP